MREAKKLPYIEKCKAVFVTSNSLLVYATKNYLKEIDIEVGFPLVITGEDLCVLAWLKDFEQNNNLPQMRLLENVLAAITPTKELMDAYFSHLENLEEQGNISEEEAAFLRVDMFARHELMELTCGDKEKLSKKVIDSIRDKIRSESRENGYKQGRNEIKQENEKRMQEQINKACKMAEEEVTRDMQKVEYEFKLLMKKADNDMEKFKTVSVMASNQLTTLSNILNDYSNQVLSIPTNTINEAEIKHRTELLDGINNMSMRITELLIDLMR